MMLTSCMQSRALGSALRIKKNTAVLSDTKGDPSQEVIIPGKNSALANYVDVAHMNRSSPLSMAFSPGLISNRNETPFA